MYFKEGQLYKVIKIPFGFWIKDNIQNENYKWKNIPAWSTNQLTIKPTVLKARCLLEIGDILLFIRITEDHVVEFLCGKNIVCKTIPAYKLNDKLYWREIKNHFQRIV